MVVESLTKSGECSLAVLTEINFSFSMGVERNRQPLIHQSFQSLEHEPDDSVRKCGSN